jgi:hypothetical protein
MATILRLPMQRGVLMIMDYSQSKPTSIACRTFI